MTSHRYKLLCSSAKKDVDGDRFRPRQFSPKHIRNLQLVLACRYPARGI